MAQTVNISQLALSVEDLLRPFTGETEGFRERTEQLDDLGNVIVVFAVFSAGLRIEEVVASDELKDLNSVNVRQCIFMLWTIAQLGAFLPCTPYSTRPYSRPISRQV